MKGAHLPLEESLRAERLFCKGAPAPGKLEQGRFPVDQAVGEEEPPKVALAPGP